MNHLNERIIRQKEWRGVIGRVPSDEEMRKGLEEHGLFLYFGHSSGEQYLQSHHIKRLRSCPVSVLMGCSSGMLRQSGEFGPWGSALSYLMAGSPCVVANLWDVTDRDIDRFTWRLFKLWGLRELDEIQEEEEEEEEEVGEDDAEIEDDDDCDSSDGKVKKGLFQRSLSICQALGASRNVCKLGNLVGAAPICYGIPVHLIP